MSNQTPYIMRDQMVSPVTAIMACHPGRIEKGRRQRIFDPIAAATGLVLRIPERLLITLYRDLCIPLFSIRRPLLRAGIQRLLMLTENSHANINKTPTRD